MLKKGTMRKATIQAVNGILLLLLLIGLPAAVRLELGAWEVRSRGQLPWLIFWGALLAGGVNLVMARWGLRRRPERALCWQWLVAFGLIAVVEGMILMDWIHFDWLKELLQGIRSMFKP
jgi:hypothetical protein